MEQLGKARFTKADAKDLAMSITSFVHHDNIMTRHGWDTKDRLLLTEDEFESTGPSTNGMNVSVFRNAGYEFVNSLIDRLQDLGFNWDTVGIRREEFLQRTGELKLNSKNAVTKDDIEWKAFQSIEAFQTELQRVLTKSDNANRAQQTLKDVLMEKADRRRTTRNYLMEEGASEKEGDEYLKVQDAEAYFDMLDRAEQMGDAIPMGHGAGH
jgi:hypothetical protein